MSREPSYSFPSFSRLTAKYSIFFFHKIGFQGRANVSEEARDLVREAAIEVENICTHYTLRAFSILVSLPRKLKD